MLDCELCQEQLTLGARVRMEMRENRRDRHREFLQKEIEFLQKEIHSLKSDLLKEKD